MELRTRSGWIALIAAPIGAAQAIARQAASAVWWPFWVDDLLVAIVLGVAGWLVIRETDSTRARMLSAAWGAMLLTVWGSTFRHLDQLPDPEVGYHPLMTVITLAMFSLLGLSVLGLAFSLPTTKKPFIGTRPSKE